MRIWKDLNAPFGLKECFQKDYLYRVVRNSGMEAKKGYTKYFSDMNQFASSTEELIAYRAQQAKQKNESSHV